MPDTFFTLVTKVFSRAVTGTWCKFMALVRAPLPRLSTRGQSFCEPTTTPEIAVGFTTPWLPTIEQRIAALDLGTICFDPQAYEINAFIKLTEKLSAKISALDSSEVGNCGAPLHMQAPQGINRSEQFVTVKDFAHSVDLTPVINTSTWEHN